MNYRMKNVPAAIAAMFLLAVASPSAAEEAAPLEITVVTTGASSLYLNSTLVMGKDKAVLIDAPFTLADTHRLIAEILESGKALETIYVTHSHPDHFFGLSVLARTFPTARIIAPPEVVADIWATIPHKLERWGPGLGRNGPEHPVAPKPIEADYFALEGHRLEIIGPIQGDNVRNTAIWIPEISTLITGDLAFHKIHVWLGEHTPEMRTQWIESLDRLMALEPDTVVAGHTLPGLANSPASLEFTRDYIVQFNAVTAEAESSEAAIKAMKERFPESRDVLDDFILGTSARVATGEIPPWDE